LQHSPHSKVKSVEDTHEKNYNSDLMHPIMV